MSFVTSLLRRNGHKGEARLAGQVDRLAEAVRERDDSLEFLKESLAELEMALEDKGWLKLGWLSQREFSRAGLTTIIRMARLMYLKNPLIKHGVQVQAHYVFGQGMTVQAEHPLVGDAVTRFLDDPKNQVELTGHQARMLKEVELAITGNVFLVFFTDKRTGRVRVRSIPVEEIAEIVCDPEDARSPWYYKRVWTEQRVDLTSGAMIGGARTAYYPDWGLAQRDVAATIGRAPVEAESPVYHIKAGGYDGMKFGVPEVYAALDWAMAVKEDLEDFATIRRALSRFAWSLTTKGGAKGVVAAKAKLGTTLGSGLTSSETNPPPVVGSTFIAAEGAADMKPITTRNAGMLPDDARSLWLMVSAGLGIPHTILAGDADVGNLATAKTLDRPTELMMRARQEVWRDVFSRVLGYVIDQAAIAPGAKLPGKQEVDDERRQVIVLGDDEETGEPINRHLDIDFPPILERDVDIRVSAIVRAATLDGKAEAGTMSDKLLTRLLLGALEVDDIDEEIQTMFPEGQETATEARFARALRDVREALVAHR